MLFGGVENVAVIASVATASRHFLPILPFCKQHDVHKLRGKGAKVVRVVKGKVTFSPISPFCSGGGSGGVKKSFECQVASA
jgi:hypothetical protein